MRILILPLIVISLIVWNFFQSEGEIGEVSDWVVEHDSTSIRFSVPEVTITIFSQDSSEIITTSVVIGLIYRYCSLKDRWLLDSLLIDKGWRVVLDSDTFGVKK